ncbi:hypothetical protein BV25DRAFT_1870219 [Artomyces pyxidatus]|uniref:Uncharacterized protein n=1 Tax=Artomyces pyxidatus TaxID=48021 RepID=A0ACB8T3X0_9AGAM|nr:hypothetical protein BV25DRAFT_1870219 [Artomyces pyxidatus]
MSAREPRTLVLCLDGSWAQYNPQRNTNVVKFYALLDKDHVEGQACYYQAGVGTYFEPGVVSPLLTTTAKLLDMAFAWYLSEHVLDGYRFLMQNYNVGDKVCLFGFSRGAYTARALAGMIKKVGLLSKDNFEQVSFAYKIYTSTDEDLARGFKEIFSRDVPIEFVGVWDTVASVGLVLRQTLPYVSWNSGIKTLRHAVALDEHRVRFNPSLYDMTGEGDTVTTNALHSDADTEKDTDAEEVWFVGGHTDIGGGAEPESVESSLSHIALRWMVREVIRADCGIVFDAKALAEIGVSATPGPVDGPADPRDEKDAMATRHCDLRTYPIFWLLEFLPSSYNTQNPLWRVPRWGLHLGRGREAHGALKFHTTVKIRMDNMPRYKPKARYHRDGDEVTYVW